MSYRALVGLFAVGSLVSAAWAQAPPAGADPLEQYRIKREVPGAVLPSAEGWSAEADPPAAPVAWPEKLKPAVTIAGDADKVLFPTQPSHFLADRAGGFNIDALQVWDLATGKKAGKLKSKTGNLQEIRLSPDGKYLLGRVLEGGNQCKLEVWSLESGVREREIAVDQPPMIAHALDFGGPGEIWVHTFGQTGGTPAFAHRFRVFSIKTGEKLRESDNEAKFDAHCFSISPGGRYIATREGAELLLYDLKTCRKSGAMKFAGGADRPEAIQFSPAGDKLAVALSGSNACILLALDLKTGDIDAQHPYAASFDDLVPGGSYEGPKLEWSPDGRLWLLGGTMAVEAKTGRRVWSLVTAPNEYRLDNTRRRLPVSGGFAIVQGSRGKGKVAVLPLDDKLVAKAGESEQDEAAQVAPGRTVGLKVEIKNVLHGDAKETEELLTGALSQWLEQNGFTLEEGPQPITLKVTYGEKKAGDYSSSKRNGPAREATGKVSGTSAALQFAWLKGAKPVWSYEREFLPNILFTRGETTPESFRRAMFIELLGEMFSFPIAYYVSADGKMSLPVQATVKRD